MPILSGYIHQQTEDVPEPDLEPPDDELLISIRTVWDWEEHDDLMWEDWEEQEGW